MKTAKLNEGHSKVMYVTKPLPYSSNECHTQEQFGVHVLRMGDGNVMDGKPFLQGVMYALSNVGPSKWKYFWRCDLENELLAGMDPRGDTFITWCRNDTLSITHFGFLSIPLVPSNGDGSFPAKKDVQKHYAANVWHFCSSSPGVEVVISRTGGRLIFADADEYKASSSISNVVYNSELDCVTAATINAFYLVAGKKAAQILFAYAEGKPSRTKGIGLAGIIVNGFGTKKLGYAVRKSHCTAYHAINSKGSVPDIEWIVYQMDGVYIFELESTLQVQWCSRFSLKLRANFFNETDQMFH